jgi:MFS family permease
MAAGPALGSWIAGAYSREAMFLCSTLLAVCSILFIAGMKETVTRSTTPIWKMFWIAPNEILDPSVWLPSSIMFLSVFCFGIVLTISPDLGDLMGVSNRGLFFTVMLCASIGIRLVTGKASDRLGRVLVLKVAMCFLLAAMLLLGFVHNIIGYYAGALVYGIAAGIASPAVFAWTIDLGNPGYRGRAISTMFIALEAGVFLGSVVSGAIYNDQYERIYLAYICGMVSSALAIVVLFAVGNKKGRNLPALNI